MKWLIVTLLVCLIPALSFAADRCETITVAGSAIGFTTTLITSGSFEAKIAECTLETAQIRYWTALPNTPTSGVGRLWEVGQSIVFDTRSDIVGFKAIKTGASSGVLSCCYN